MLTLKQITDNKAAIIAGLEKKCFANAAETIDQVIALNENRKAIQQTKDAAQAEMNRISKEIGMLFKQGKQEEAAAAKAKTGELKENIAQYEAQMAEAEQALTSLLLTIPNVPYDLVPDGRGAEDNIVVKSNVPHHGGDTVGTWVGEVNNDEAKLPHWDLALNYNFTDFDRGV